MTQPQGTAEATTAETRLFKMGHARLASTLLYLYGLGTVGALALLAVAGIVAGFVFDLRWAILGLMVIFIVSPLVMAFLYFWHGLRPSTASNTVEHRLALSPEGVTVSVYSSSEPDWESEEDEEPEMSVRYSRFYPKGSIRRYIAGAQGYLILLGVPYYGFLWLPYDAFADKTMMEQAVTLLSSKLSNAKENENT